MMLGNCFRVFELFFDDFVVGEVVEFAASFVDGLC